ncbi:MAG: nucleotide exchange factor GrpE [Chloroherpetonaceae bacterium]|nr:nucleotide exchange factor GrpE [Chthonomonadaceae bacterium]MDW8207257.1 nucleotide exchange factor GrpE [Chloroherpetonaceae bacterium]
MQGEIEVTTHEAGDEKETSDANPHAGSSQHEEPAHTALDGEQNASAPVEEATAQHASGDSDESAERHPADGEADGATEQTIAPEETITPDPIAALTAELEQVRAQKEEAEKRLLYVHAEFQNFRRRKEEEVQSLVKFANAELIRSLLPVLDNFERALQAAEQTRNFDALVGGVSGTMKQLQSALQKVGVTPIEAAGKEFDPNFHEAIGRVPADGHPSNTVAEEVQKGYMLHDRVLRPALVKVFE